MFYLVRLILTSRYPDVYIFLLLGLIISIFDILLINWKDTPLFYEYIGKHGLIAIIVVSVATILFTTIVYVVIHMFITTSRDKGIEKIVDIHKRAVKNYLGAQNIILSDGEEILMVAAKEPLYDGFVLTNYRIFQYEVDRIINNVYFKDVIKVDYKRTFMRTIISFYLKDGSKNIFDIRDILGSKILAKTKEIMRNKA